MQGEGTGHLLGWGMYILHPHVGEEDSGRVQGEGAGQEMHAAQQLKAMLLPFVAVQGREEVPSGQVKSVNHRSVVLLVCRCAGGVVPRHSPLALHR